MRRIKKYAGQRNTVGIIPLRRKPAMLDDGVHNYVYTQSAEFKAAFVILDPPVAPSTTTSSVVMQGCIGDPYDEANWFDIDGTTRTTTGKMENSFPHSFVRLRVTAAIGNVAATLEISI